MFDQGRYQVGQYQYRPCRLIRCDQASCLGDCGQYPEPISRLSGTFRWSIRVNQCGLVVRGNQVSYQRQSCFGSMRAGWVALCGSGLLESLASLYVELFNHNWCGGNKRKVFGGILLDQLQCACYCMENVYGYMVYNGRNGSYFTWLGSLK